MPQNNVETPEYLYYSPTEFVVQVEHPRGYFDGKPVFTRLMPLFQAIFKVDREDGLKFGDLFPDGFQEDVSGMSFPTIKGEQDNPREFTLFPIQLERSPQVLPQPINIKGFVANYEKLLGGKPSIVLQDDPLIILKPALPNWFVGSSTHLGLGTHGPGRRPRPITLNTPSQLDFNFDVDFERKELGDKNLCDIDIYILDTVPPKARIQDAWKTWGGSSLNRFQSILESTNAGGPVSSTWKDSYITQQATYYYADPLSFEDTKVSLNGHLPHPIILRNWFKDGPKDNPNKHNNYDSSDHGLFITGIVNSIVPKAAVYVMQVFNNFGVGTFLSIAAGFQMVSQKHDPKRLAIINCSFTLSYPDFDLNSPQRALSIDATETLFDAVVRSIGSNATIVAASGNDSERDKNKVVPARHLASTNLAIGVGALKADLKTPADYSNDADIPENQGFMVFGGDYVDDPPTAGGKGVIGIFTGNLNINTAPNPEGFQMSWNKVKPTTFLPEKETTVAETTDNDNGLAEWAGTSFAAPILAATFARICCSNGGKTTQALDTLRHNSKSDKNCAPWTFDKVWQGDDPRGAAAS